MLTVAELDQVQDLAKIFKGDESALLAEYFENPHQVKSLVFNVGVDFA